MEIDEALPTLAQEIRDYYSLGPRTMHAGGSVGQVQFNDGGNLAGASGITYSKTTAHSAIGPDALPDTTFYAPETIVETLLVSETFSGNPDDVIFNLGIEQEMLIDPSANSSNAIVGIASNMRTKSTNSKDIGDIQGLVGIIDHVGTGTLLNAEGVQVEVANNSTGTISFVTGVYVHGGNLNAGGSIGDWYGVYIQAPLHTGPVTNAYGLYITDHSAASTTAKFNIYSLGATALNYVEGVLAVGVAAPGASAKLQVDSTTQGILPPRMTTTEKNAITSPAEGLLIYDTSLHALCFYNGSAWKTVTVS